MGEHDIVRCVKSEDFLTLAAALASMTAIFHFIGGQHYLGVALLLSAAVIDFLDGMIARKRNATTEFGRNLDFLQDVITYCVSVAVLLHMTLKAAWLDYLLVLFVSSSMARLARQQMQKPKDRNYLGLPVTFNLMLALMYFIGIKSHAAYALVITVLSLLMVSGRRFRFI